MRLLIVQPNKPESGVSSLPHNRSSSVVCSLYLPLVVPPLSLCLLRVIWRQDGLELAGRTLTSVDIPTFAIFDRTPKHFRTFFFSYCNVNDDQSRGYFGYFSSEPHKTLHNCFPRLSSTDLDVCNEGNAPLNSTQNKKCCTHKCSWNEWEAAAQTAESKQLDWQPGPPNTGFSRWSAAPWHLFYSLLLWF